MKVKKELLVKIVDYYDFDQIVNETYSNESHKTNYEFVADEECGNDEDHLFDGISRTPKYTWSYNEEVKARVAKWALGQAGRYENPTTNELLFDLCAKGVIEEGNYLIRVSW